MEASYCLVFLVARVVFVNPAQMDRVLLIYRKLILQVRTEHIIEELGSVCGLLNLLVDLLES